MNAPKVQSSEGKYLDRCMQLCFNFFSLADFSASVSACNDSALLGEGDAVSESGPGEGAGATFAERWVKTSAKQAEISRTC